jgi:hypothetical protein
VDEQKHPRANLPTWTGLRRVSAARLRWRSRRTGSWWVVLQACRRDLRHALHRCTRRTPRASAWSIWRRLCGDFVVERLRTSWFSAHRLLGKSCGSARRGAASCAKCGCGGPRVPLCAPAFQLDLVEIHDSTSHRRRLSILEHHNPEVSRGKRRRGFPGLRHGVTAGWRAATTTAGSGRSVYPSVEREPLRRPRWQWPHLNVALSPVRPS